jgi:type I restriction enzyme S subunit
MSALPEGWYHTTVGKSAKLLTGYPFASAHFSSSGLRLIRGSNVKRSMIDWSADIAKYWSSRDISLHAFELEDGDVVIAMDGALVGRSYARIAERHLPAYLVQRVARLRGTTVDQGLLYAWIGSDAFVQHVDSVRTHTAIPHIRPRDIRDFPIVVPVDLVAQRRIAEALTSIDHQIGALERLIAKREAINQGMMQQLLTGGARLPGFAGKWPEVRLGEIANIKTGSRNNQDKQITGRYPFYVRSATVERIDTYSYDCEAILVPGEGGIGSIFHYVDGKFEVHQRVYKISQFDAGTAGKFVYYYMKQFFGRYAMEHSVKATVDSLRLPTFVGFAMRTPEDVDEQRAIAAVLDDSEAEIGRLGSHLTKAEAIKQGMMQELLTGRTRLPVMEEVAA